MSHQRQSQQTGHQAYTEFAEQRLDNVFVDIVHTQQLELPVAVLQCNERLTHDPLHMFGPIYNKTTQILY